MLTEKKRAWEDTQRRKERDRVHREEESASKIGRVKYNLNCNFNICFQYKKNDVNINIGFIQETDVNLSYVNIGFQKIDVNEHRLTSVFFKPDVNEEILTSVLEKPMLTSYRLHRFFKKPMLRSIP